MSQPNSVSEGPAAAPGVDGSKMWALLIGIDDYAALPKLQGCVNDVKAVEAFLRHGLGVPQDHISVITDGQATRAGMLAAIQGLIDNPAIERGDQILLHYSGHGSYMPSTDPAEPDGRDETIVPQDSRTANVFDISDKTMAGLLAQLAAVKGDQITVVLDSCHSGGAARDTPAPGEAMTRGVPDDRRRPPADLDARWRLPRPQPGSAPTPGNHQRGHLGHLGQRGVAASGWAAAPFSYVLLAGCREREVSNEFVARDGETTVTHGALTYFLLRGLQQREGPGQRTYGELHETVAAWVNGYYPQQMPQCEGDRDRLVFGGAHVECDPFLTVTQTADDGVTLDGGLAHGLRQGTQLALYPPTLRMRRDLPPQPLATIEVTVAAATSSVARILPLPHPTGGVPLHARALVTRQADADLQQTVAIHAADEPDADAGHAGHDVAPSGLRNGGARGGSSGKSLLHDLRRRLTPPATGSPYLRLAPPGSGAADLHVWRVGDAIHLCGADRDLMAIVPCGADVGGAGAVDSALRALESIARFRWLHQLSNTDPASRLAGRIKLRLRRRHAAGSSPQPAAESAPAGDAGPPTLLYDPANRNNNLYSVEVQNDADLPVYVTVFAMSQDYSITRIYPRLGQQDELVAGRMLPCGVGDRRELLEIYLPDDPRWQRSRDSVLAIVTTVPSDLAMLEQRALTVPPAGSLRSSASSLERLLALRLAAPASRFARPNQEAVAEDWATAELRFEVAHGPAS